MGITLEEILARYKNLLEKVQYWKVCQPWLVPEGLEESLVDGINKIEAAQKEG